MTEYTDDELDELAEQMGVPRDDIEDVLSDLSYQDYSEQQKDIEHAVFLDESGIGGFDLDSGDFY